MKATSFFYNALRAGIYMLPLAILCTALLTVSPALAGEEDGAPEVKLSVKPTPLAKDVETGLDYLFEMLNDTSASFDATKIGPMLDFVSATQDPKDIAPAKRFKGHGICLKQDVSSDLSTILRYFYNPEIPNYLLCPAVLRLSGWRDGSELLTRDTPLWDELETLDQPVLVRGQEFEVNTPDAFAEAYYRYDLKRLIVLLKYNGKNVAISISEQADKSDVGRKGAILNDKEWEYFYSGIEGLNKGLIGWMDSFMYKSASVQIFMENDAAAPNSSVFLFKWLNAGWAGMNVVKRSHIYDGSLRYARSFVKVLESTTLTPEEVADSLKDVRTLSTPEIDTLIKEYSKNFEIRFKDNPKLKSREYAKVIKDGKYFEVLDVDARKSVLALEKLKCMMNMDTLLDLCASPVAKAEN